MTTRNTQDAPAIDRRQVWKQGVAAAGAAWLAVQSGMAGAKDGDRSRSGSGSGSAPAPAPAPRPVPVPDAPYTAPFVEALPIPATRQPATGANSRLIPVASEFRTEGESGRAPHQRWNELLPQKHYDVHVKEGWHSYHPALPRQLIWGYDGVYPGPTFKEHYGAPVLARFYNDLPEHHVGFGSPEISTHLHNLHASSACDGFPGDFYSATKSGPTLIDPVDARRPGKGRYKDHHYANCYAGYDAYHGTEGDPREALGTLFMHDHCLNFTAPNVYKGLLCFYLLFDALDAGDETLQDGKNLGLPSGEFDVPLLLQCKQFDAGGYLAFNQTDPEGTVGNRFVVNGKIQPYFKVKRRKYRLRLLDGDALRFFEVYLTHNGSDQDFTYIANDGNLLPKPLRGVRKVRLGMAERADIVVDFSKYKAGDTLYLVDRISQTSPRGPSEKLVKPGTPLLRFDVEGDPATPDVSRVPDTLRELPPLPSPEELAKLKVRKWEFDRSKGSWTVNNKLFDVHEKRAVIKRGAGEVWVLSALGGWYHPIHIHFEEGRILSRNGKPPAAHEAGRKDVYVLAPDDVVHIYMQFRDFTGRHVMHCHNLVHEDHEMMVRWDIEA